MVEKYNDINERRLDKGLHELMKMKVNGILNNIGPITLSIAYKNYFSALKIAEGLAIDCSEYKMKVKEFKDELKKNKLEKISK